MNPGVYTYTITVPPPCVSVNSTVTVSEVQPPDAGMDDALTLCISSPAASLFASLGGSPDAGGSWTDPNGLAHSGTFNPANDPAGDYTYTVSGTAPCPSASAVVTVSVVALPDAGLPGSITLCATDGPADLFAQLNGTPDAGGSWTGPSPVVGGQYDPANMNPGVYTYTIVVPPPCVSVNSTVTVSEVQPPDAGLDDALTLCISSPPTGLFASLGGSPDAGGSWIDANGNAHSGTFNPANDPAGVYTYTVSGTAPCPSASAVVTVSVVALPDAGLPGSITLCTTDGPTDLFAQLNGTPDAGGTWTDPNGVAQTNQIDPASDPAGIYTYTIAVPPPCVSVTSTVTVSLATPPDAGSDGAITLCISSPATGLFASLGGSPDAGGTWTDPNGVAHSGSFDPANDVIGDYTYTVNGTAPCPSDLAVVTVSVVSLPDPGLPGAITWCTTDPIGDLFAQLGGTPDAGGSWTDPNGDPFSGTFDPAADAPGTYTYTITVPPPCVSVTSTVAVAISTPPDPGIDGSLTLCISSPSEDLFASLGGSPDLGGTWTDPNGVTHSGTFDPSNDVPGDYTYTVNGSVPCPAASAVVTVSVVSLPDPGLPGAITLCTTDPIGDLFAQLGGTPDAGGSWTDPNGDPFSGTFDPATDAPGTYTYTITVPPPCVSVTSTVAVAISTPPDPGTDGSLTLCVSSPPSDLFASLGGAPDPGGTWIDPNGNAHSGNFVPGVDQPGVYTYTVTGTSPCPNAAASATVTVVNLPDPGAPGALMLCTSDAPTDLFAQLGGTPDAGGSWTDPNGNAHSGTINPANDPAGVYTYTITVPPPCSSVSATVAISLSIPPDAGSNGVLSACATGAPQDLFSLLGGSPDAGGSWMDPNGVAHAGLFDPIIDPAGNYTYAVAGTPPCPAASAVIAVNIVTEPNAGTDAILNLCAAGAPAPLFPELGNADPGGTWTDPNGNSFAGLFTPGLDPAGAYTYTVTGTAPCPNDQGVITVVLLTDPDAGIDGTLTLCGNASGTDLFPSLSGSPDPGGAWTDPNGLTHSGNFDPALDAAGTYMYLLFVPPPCVSDTAFVAVSVVVPPDAGSDGAITLCSNDGPVQLINSLGGTPDVGGVWTNTGGTVMSGTFDPAVDPDGIFTYTVQGTTPCLDAAANVLVTVEPLPDAGLDGSVTVCPEAPNVDLFQLLGGTPDLGGSWTDPYGVACSATFDPGVDPIGAYTYTVFGITACPNVSASATVNVFLIAPPDAGPDQVSCTLEATLAATGVWNAGFWSGPSDVSFADPNAANTTITATNGGPHLLFWTVSTPDGCASLDSVTVVLTTQILPVTGASDAVCFGECNGSMVVAVSGGNPAPTGYTYQWSNGVAGPADTAAWGLCAGTYTVTCVDENGCSASATAVVTEPPPLVIDALAGLPETCPGSCDGTVIAADTEGLYFSLNGGAFQLGGYFPGLCPGPYNIMMMDAAGCKAIGLTNVATPPPVEAAFSYAPDTIFIDDPTVQFFDASSPNAVNFLWDFAGLGSSTLEYPEFTFPDGEGGMYEVCLTASDANNCPDEICTTVVIYDLLIVHVPNAFTPDGDGINDGFVPIFNLPWVDNYEFLIFDRWGERIFTSTTPGETWDGNYHGVAVESEVYVWELKYRDMLSRDYGKARGHVTVLR
ncbi:MAG: gliding motility-associated C-terminal domain-containing protein [Flavobacteriales bacterium]|nr:gliding motility-associated C-terminal domain-containing protein [Flavobacteriales bacterium]